MHELGRRDALKLALAGVAGLAARDLLAQELKVETQYGDPALPREQLAFNPDDVLAKVAGSTKAAFTPRISDFNRALVAAARTHVGESRQTHRTVIEGYLELFDLPFAADGKVVPFCAAGLSYVATMLYAQSAGAATPSLSQLRNALGDIDHHHFYPSPSVLSMKYVALGKGRWVARSQATGSLAPKPGWLVVYDWNRDGNSDHVGLVEQFTGAELHTIEFNTSAADNTNGGSVARRTRSLNRTVEGFIRPDLVKPA